MINFPEVTMVVDLQFGSTGKGAIAGYLSYTGDFDTVISANMPNAGHTAYDHMGVKYVHKVLPSGIFNKGIKRVMIGPGAVFDPARLEEEVRFAINSGWLTKAWVFVHNMSVPLTSKMKEAEESSPVTAIASTAQGSMIAQVAKMTRNPKESVVARDAYVPSLDLPIIKVTNVEWKRIIRGESKRILAEAAQGFSLGINNDFYPYCTSRDCGPARFLSDMALPVKCPLTVVGSLRTYPIRVGNTDKGTSGGYYDDQIELTWGDIGVAPELTTVTGRVRRVFSFSMDQFEEAISTTCCDEVFVNFLNYLSKTEQEEFILALGAVSERHSTAIRYLGFGPYLSDISEVPHAK